jgi:CheY-like chemotaxis protein
VGGIPAELEFVAAAPHAVAGLLQLNFRVPWNAPAGDAVPLVLTVGNASSSAIATMAVRPARDRVMVAARDGRSRTQMTAALRQAGYRVFAAGSADEALEVGRSQVLDLMVVDVPEGERLVEAMRTAQPRLKVVAVVDSMGAEALRAADLMGSQAVVARPVTTALLIARVRRLIRRRTPMYFAGDIVALPGRPR